MSGDSPSVERVRAALRDAGHADTVAEFPDGTRTSAEAAAAIGCTVAQIAKSMVFDSDVFEGIGGLVLVIASGANRVDMAKAGAAAGRVLRRADAGRVRELTGFAIGGVAPVGHVTPPLVLLDRDLLALDPLWAAAGTPRHVFRTSATELARLTGGAVADIRASSGAQS